MKYDIYNLGRVNMQSIEQQLLIPEERIVTPLVEVLNTITPKPESSPKSTEAITPALRQSLDELFPEQKFEDKDIQKAKEILGPIASEFTPEQLRGSIIEIHLLAQSWLDDLERDIFKGLTLKEVLHEKGGL